MPVKIGTEVLPFGIFSLDQVALDDGMMCKGVAQRLACPLVLAHSFGDNVLCAGNYLLWCLDAFLRVQIAPGNLCQRRCSSLGLYDVGHGL